MFWLVRGKSRASLRPYDIVVIGSKGSLEGRRNPHTSDDDCLFVSLFRKELSIDPIDIEKAVFTPIGSLKARYKGATRTLPQTANFLPLITTSLFSNSSISGQLAALGESRLETTFLGSTAASHMIWNLMRNSGKDQKLAVLETAIEVNIRSTQPESCLDYHLWGTFCSWTWAEFHLFLAIWTRLKNHWWEPNSQSSPRKESYNHILPLQITELASSLWLAYTMFLCSLTGESLVNAHIVQE